MMTNFKVYELAEHIRHNFKIPKLLVDDFNFSNIEWYRGQFGGNARCCRLSDNDMRFMNSLYVKICSFSM